MQGPKRYVMFVVMAVGVSIGLTPSWYSLIAQSDTSRFSFEDAKKGTMGWSQRYGDKGAQAVVQASRTTDEKLNGIASLKVDVSFSSVQSSQQHAGEIAVDFVSENPFGAPNIQGTPVDLSNKMIRAYVKFKPDFPLSETNPAGLQIFVKDAEYNSVYGCWTNIESVAKWIPLSLNPSTLLDEGGCKAKVTNLENKPPFNPARIRRIGVKVAAGGGGFFDYSGSFYLDSVDWDSSPGKARK